MAAMVGGLGAGIVGAVLLLLLRHALRSKWTVGFTVAMVAFVSVGAVAPGLLLPSTVRDARPVAHPLGRATAGLSSSDLSERLGAIHLLETQMWGYNSPHQPSIMTALSAFVRDRALPAGDPRCGGEELAEDIDLAMTVLGRRGTAGDGDAVIDLHGVCLAGIELGTWDFQRANLSGVDLTGAGLTNTAFGDANLTSAKLTGANLRHASLAGTDFTDADLDGADLSGASWSDGTLWPPAYEQLVLAASTFATTEYVIGELRLPDPQ